MSSFGWPDFLQSPRSFMKRHKWMEQVHFAVFGILPFPSFIHPNDAIYMLQHLFSNWFANLDLQKLCAAAVVVAGVIMGLILILQIAWGKEEF